MTSFLGSAGGHVTAGGVLTLIVPLAMLAIVIGWALVGHRRSP